MALYLIGLGLGNEKDITVKGLDVVRKAKFVYLESYTSKLNCSVEELEKFYFTNTEKSNEKKENENTKDSKTENKNTAKKIILADRNLVENNAEEILNNAKTSDVAFLVVGDVFSATTHHDLRLRALNAGIKVEIINNVSIMTAVGITGLDLYKFGRTTTIVFPEPNFSPETPYGIIKMNLANGLHTLCLLDIKVEVNADKENSANWKNNATEKDNAKAGKKRDVYMDINDALHLLLAIEEKRKEKVIDENTKVIGCTRLGSKNQLIKFGTIKQLLTFDFGKPLHALIIPCKLHFMEEEVLDEYKV